MRGEVTWKEPEGDWVFKDYRTQDSLSVVEAERSPVVLYNARGEEISFRRKAGFGK